MTNPTATILAPTPSHRQTLALEREVERARHDAIRPSADGSHRLALQRYRVAWARLVEARRNA